MANTIKHHADPRTKEGKKLLAFRKAARDRKTKERRENKAAGRVAIMFYIYPETREKLRAYVKKLNAAKETAA